MTDGGSEQVQLPSEVVGDGELLVGLGPEAEELEHLSEGVYGALDAALDDIGAEVLHECEEAVSSVGGS